MLKPTSTSVALLDNSVYFSFRSLAKDGLLDPLSLYNAASFLETFILNDRLYLSPTNAWTPESSDTFFQTAGPCRQLKIDSYSESDIYAVFTAVLDNIRADITIPQIARTLSLTPNMLAEISQLVNAWRSKLESDPSNFWAIYSGAVYNVDTSIHDFLKHLSTTVEPTDTPGRHIAQYLLRVNAAMHFAREAFAAPIPYVPHSHRTQFVTSKAHHTRLSALKVGRALINYVNLEQVELHRKYLAGSLLNQLNPSLLAIDESPLILAVTLSGCRAPDDLIKRAMEIRNSSEAQRCRRWMARIIQDAESGNYERVKEADSELLAARKSLSAELRKLYGKPNSGGVVRGFTSVLDYIDVKALISGDPFTFGAKFAKGLLENAERVQKITKNHLLKRNLALLSGMAKTRATAKTMNDLVQKVFKTTLSEGQLAALQGLVQQQEIAMRPLRRQKRSSAKNQ